MANKEFKLNIEVGKSYNLRYPGSHRKKPKVHIDYILDSKAYSTDTGEPEKMVVYRIWLSNREGWQMYINYYTTLQDYNDPHYD